jgi:hypothetical protein
MNNKKLLLELNDDNIINKNDEISIDFNYYHPNIGLGCNRFAYNFTYLSLSFSLRIIKIIIIT